MKHLNGPVFAQLIEVVDGDTVLVDALPWPQHSIRVSVRLRDIDTPELKSKCLADKQAALAAKYALLNLLNDKSLHLKNITIGKYYGRVIADIETKDGINASLFQLENGHAVAYKDRKKRKSACD